MSPFSPCIRGLARAPLSRAVAALSVLAGVAAPAQANIDIKFDYSLDTNAFFGSQARKDVLEAAAAAFESRLADTLTAINPGGGNVFNANIFDPQGVTNTITFNNQQVLANQLLVYVGASDLAGSTLGLGGPGGFSVGGSGAFVQNAVTRGQAGANGSNPTDFGPWGGAISFDSATSWYFDSNTSTTEAFSGFDFYTVAVHELAHVLGFGIAGSWDTRVVNTNFVGPAAGTQALSVDLAHWASGSTSTVNGLSQATAMSPSVGAGQRKYFTDLDYAGLQDIGWQVTSAVPEPASVLLWGAGLGLVALRRRRTAA